MSKLSILDLEQRINPTDEYQKLYITLSKEPFITLHFTVYSFIEHMDKVILTLPYVGSSNSFESYWSDRGITMSIYNKEKATTSLLYLISFYLTYSSYVEQDYLLQKKLHLNCSLKVKNSITTILKHLNYQVIYEKENNQYGFQTPLIIKRDVDVDSTLSLIKNTDIHIDLLSYLDFRLESNLQAKQSILARLYKTIIDDEKEVYFSSLKTDDCRLKYQYELYERIKQIYNQTDIRHGEKGKVELSTDEKLKYCDMCFYLLLQLIRTPKSIEDMKEIKSTFGQKNK